MQSLIDAIRHDDQASAYLAGPGDLDFEFGGRVKPVHLASGMALEQFARDGAGGAYFFCGGGEEERPILYTDSDGAATLLAVGLPELIQLLLVAPWWCDCVAFTAEESSMLAAEYLADMPDLEADRDHVAEVLGLELPSVEQALARLCEVALDLGREFVAIFTPAGTTCRPLIMP